PRPFRAAWSPAARSPSAIARYTMTWPGTSVAKPTSRKGCHSAGANTIRRSAKAATGSNARRTVVLSWSRRRVRSCDRIAGAAAEAAAVPDLRDRVAAHQTSVGHQFERRRPRLWAQDAVHHVGGVAAVFGSVGSIELVRDV